MAMAEMNSSILHEKILDNNFADYVMNVVEKTVKHEDILSRQILYTGLSAYTSDPINLGIIAPTSEGKTYPVTETLRLFPQEDIWKVGSMSPMALFRQKGILVDQNNEPLELRLKQMEACMKNV